MLSRFLIDNIDAIAEGHALSRICAVRVHHRMYVRSYLLFTRKTWSDLDGQLEQNDRQDTLKTNINSVGTL
jgi:hypothetical protein